MPTKPAKTPTKKTAPSKSAGKVVKKAPTKEVEGVKKVASPKVKSEKKVTPKKTVVKKDEGDTLGGTSLQSLRADLYILNMKHALHELKEVHKIKEARKAIARYLTQLNKKK